MVKDWRKLKNALSFKPSKSTCELDRQDYFLSLAALGKKAHKLVKSKRKGCKTVVRQRLGQISNLHDNASFEADPFSLMPYVRQLSDDHYKQQAETTYGLGSGFIFIDTSAVAVSYYPSFSSSDKPYTNQQCPKFASFVNHYQKKVAPARNELLALDRLDDCKVGKLPSLKYNSCRDVDRDFPKELPAFPTVFVDENAQIVDLTDSQCMRCLRVSSRGMPCNFCASEGFSGSSTCRQHFSHFRPKCNSKKTSFVKAKIQNFDAFHDDDPRWMCVEKGKVQHVGTTFENRPNKIDALLGPISAARRATILEHLTSSDVKVEAHTAKL